MFCFCFFIYGFYTNCYTYLLLIYIINCLESCYNCFILGLELPVKDESAPKKRIVYTDKKKKRSQNDGMYCIFDSL